MSKRSIPAWAGEPGFRHRKAPEDTVYPRVGGGTVCFIVTQPLAAGLSPRGRGNPQGEQLVPHMQGSIPAWAGEPWG